MLIKAEPHGTANQYRYCALTNNRSIVRSNKRRNLHFQSKMNRVNFVFAVAACCLLVSSALTLPAPEKESAKQTESESRELLEIPNPDENEIGKDIDTDVEQIGSPESSSDVDSDDDDSEFIGESSGVITRIGAEGPCKWRINIQIRFCAGSYFVLEIPLICISFECNCILPINSVSLE